MDYVLPAVSAFAAVLLSAGIVRLFPELLSKSVLRHIDHQYQKRLASLNHDLESARAAARSSIEFLATSQSEFRSKTIAAVESLWKSVQLLEDEFMTPLGMPAILSANEMMEIASGQPDSRFEVLLSDFRDGKGVAKHMANVKAGRQHTEILFVSTELWELYEKIYKFHLLFGTHMERGLVAKTYTDWRKDAMIMTFVSVSVPEEILVRAMESDRLGQYEIVNWLKAEFVKEASDLLRGTKEIEHEVSRLQQVLRDAQEHAPQSDSYS